MRRNKKCRRCTCKKSEKTNKDLGIAKVETAKERKVRRPTPGDMAQGGGGVYREGGARRMNPSDMAHGGGGSYSDGRSSNRVSASDFQHGGGGTYQSGNTRNRQSASDVQHGGGGDMTKKSRKLFSKKK